MSTLQTLDEMQKYLNSLNITDNKREITRERYEKFQNYHQEFLKTYDKDNIEQRIELKTIEEYLDEKNYIFKH